MSRRLHIHLLVASSDHLLGHFAGVLWLELVPRRWQLEHLIARHARQDVHMCVHDDLEWESERSGPGVNEVKPDSKTIMSTGSAPPLPTLTWPAAWPTLVKTLTASQPVAVCAAQWDTVSKARHDRSAGPEEKRA